VSRSKATKLDVPANVQFRALPLGRREVKFDALSRIRLEDREWTEAPSEWRSPFLPASQRDWSTFPRLEELFIYNGSGVMPGRTWIIAPDASSLERRWETLIEAPEERKEILFHPHLRNGQPGDKHSHKIVSVPLHGFDSNKKSIADENRTEISPLEYGFRSLDRQWIIPDARVINQPNPELWRLRSEHQIYLTAPSDRSPSNGPALTFTASVPDLHHYAGRGGRACPLWADEHGNLSNIRPSLLVAISDRIGVNVEPEDFFCYVAAVGANPAFTARFQQDLSTPGLRIPITANASFFQGQR